MGTHHRGPPSEVLALDTYIKLIRAADTVSARSLRPIERLGLTESQFGILEALYHLGPMCQRALGSKILKSSGNITLVVDNLERRGWVRRERDRADRRFVTVHLTEAGRETIGEIFPGHARGIADVLASLTGEEQAELGRLCRKLGTALRADADRGGGG